MADGFVETFLVDSVKTEVLPVNSQTEDIRLQHIRELLNRCPIILGSAFGDGDMQLLPFYPAPTEFEAATIKLDQPTPQHNRSFVVDMACDLQDEFGNKYDALTLKGVNFGHSELIETGTAVNRFIAFGLQESAVIERVLKASRILRSHGIGTEYIVGVAEPKSYYLSQRGVPLSEGPVTLPEYKDYLALDRWNGLDQEARTAENYLEIRGKLDRSTYYICARAMDSEYRIQDLVIYNHVRQAVYGNVNYQRHKDGLEPFESQSDEDFYQFLSEYCVPQLSANVARLHSLGLVHTFPHALNISVFGSLVDLDSVHGEPLELGDESVTAKDYAYDVMEAMVSLNLKKAITPQSVLIENDVPNLPEQFSDAYFRQAFTYLALDKRVKLFVDILKETRDMQDKARDYWGDVDVLTLITTLERSLGNYLSEVIGRPETYVSSWSEKHKDEITDVLHAFLDQHIDGYMPTLIEDIISASLGDYRELKVEAFALLKNLDPELKVESVAYYEILEDVTEEITKGLFIYSLREDFPELFGDMTDETVTEVADLAFNSSKERTKKLSFAIEHILYPALDNFRDRINGASGLRVPPTLTFSDFESHPFSVVSNEGVLLMQSFVPLQKVYDLLAGSAEEVIIELTDSVFDFEPTSRTLNVNFEDGYVIREVVSDGTLDYAIVERDKHDYGRISSIECELISGSYVLWIESKGNSLRYKFQLFDNNEDFRKRVMEREAKDKLDLIYKKYLSQGRLFTDAG